MKIKIILSVVVLLLAGCGGVQEKRVVKEVNVDHCDPATQVVVCGMVDGQETSFMNDCFAKAYGATDIKGGLCEGDR